MASKRHKHTPRSIFLDLLGCYLERMDWAARQGCYECKDDLLANVALETYGENALKWIAGYDKAAHFYQKEFRGE